ncbi:SpoIIAA family protein [Flammeovirga agarivorans]|uniref:STAS/SEC14 domain-containing protein n=1 Tax=Flammeovirga agarivorans TaxID=2726742 RepID=A0A7X8XU18_9BACT|nr:STAS/SEC14 domain-containing protein [Flammeovirga agarivorans]NLR89911.1 STAS/SEC14 domain-containing protein [Flammeovirga agarivorans]
MIHINNSLGAQVVGITLNGEIDTKGFESFVDAVEEKAKNGKVRVLAEYTKIGGLEHYKDFFMIIKEKFAAKKHIEKFAIVSDIEWLQGVSSFADFMMSEFPIKCFNISERDQALVWLLQDDEVYSPAIKKLATDSNDNFLAYKLSGKINPQEVYMIDQDFSNQADTKSEINLYLQFDNFKGYSNISALWNDLKNGLKHYSKINKIAFVGQSNQWSDLLTRISDIITPGVNIEYFVLEDADRARTWLNLK